MYTRASPRQPPLPSYTLRPSRDAPGTDSLVVSSGHEVLGEDEGAVVLVKGRLQCSSPWYYLRLPFLLLRRSCLFHQHPLPAVHLHHRLHLPRPPFYKHGKMRNQRGKTKRLLDVARWRIVWLGWVVSSLVLLLQCFKVSLSHHHPTLLTTSPKPVSL